MNKKLTSIITVLATVFTIVVLANLDFVKTDEEKYMIKKWESTYINSTGQKAKDNKINLSDSYWEGGKFAF